MFSKFKNFIQKYIALNSNDWNIIKSKLKMKYLKKGENIHNIGNISSQIMFVNSGLARTYILDENGKDYTWGIHFNDRNAYITNLFIGDYESFINQTPSKFAIDALDDCEVIVLTYSDLEFLYANTTIGDRFGRLINQEAYTYLHNSIIDRQTKTAKERFENFMNTTPYLLEKVPQYHIATFLGITPQHLSRLKKEYIN